ncbi:MAG: cation:proton antiporter [Halobacteria archaeon]|nr:cation:proton antiporter [Halobacteria archaeon]
MAVESAPATDLATIIVTATAVGFVARRTGQPTIIAYILTGLLLGPPVLGAVTPSELTELMSELGLAFLLFLLGIKMRIEDIRHVLSPVVRVSVPQMILVAAAGAVTAVGLGFGLIESALIGAAVTYSSTAVVIKMLTDNDEATTLPGRIDISVLLVQDIAVVVLLALLSTGGSRGVTDTALTLVTVLILISLIGVASMASSRYLLPGVFRRVADDKEVFLVVSIGWAFLFILVSLRLGLSVEIGAFLAGVSIAQLPYSTELQDRITPLTDLFILVFFASVGLGLEASELTAYLGEAAVASAVLILVKFVVFFVLIASHDFSLETTFLGTIHMVQVSEFALVFGAVAVSEGLIDEGVLGFLSLVDVFTMVFSVYAIKYSHGIYDVVSPWLSKIRDWDGREEVSTEHEAHAVAVGFDRLTEDVLPILQDSYGDVVVIDRKTSHIQQLRAEGKYDYVFGDFRHAKVRKEANLKKASFVLSSSVETDVNRAIVEEVSDDTTVFVEAERTEDAVELYDAGVDYVIMSTHLAAEKVSEYLEEYFESRDAFFDATRSDIDRIRRGSVGSERRGGGDSG